MNGSARHRTARADIGDTTYLTGAQQRQILAQLLKQCGSDLMRESINRQAHNLKTIALPTFLDGVHINTTATNVQAITQLKLRRWDDKVWEEFSEVLSGADVDESCPDCARTVRILSIVLQWRVVMSTRGSKHPRKGAATVPFQNDATRSCAIDGCEERYQRSLKLLTKNGLSQFGPLSDLLMSRRSSITSR